jgi:hypothetical protein
MVGDVLDEGRRHVDGDQPDLPRRPVASCQVANSGKATPTF